MFLQPCEELAMPEPGVLRLQDPVVLVREVYEPRRHFWRGADFWPTLDYRAFRRPAPPISMLMFFVAAQAAEILATVVASNPGHIGRWVPVRA